MKTETPQPPQPRKYPPPTPHLQPAYATRKTHLLPPSKLLMTATYKRR